MDKRSALSSQPAEKVFSGQYAARQEVMRFAFFG